MLTKMQLNRNRPAIGAAAQRLVHGYALRRADDLPGFDITARRLPTASNRLGVKARPGRLHRGAADDHECGARRVLAPLGIRHLDMPATRRRVWRAIERARRTEAV